MIKNIFKNFISKSATRAYPIAVRPGFENARGELDNQIDDCIFCGICARKCPSQCISVSKKDRLWQMDPFACVYCGICVEACPKDCLAHRKSHKKPARQKEPVILQKKDTAPLKVVSQTR